MNLDAPPPVYQVGAPEVRALYSLVTGQRYVRLDPTAKDPVEAAAWITWCAAGIPTELVLAGAG